MIDIQNRGKKRLSLIGLVAFSCCLIIGMQAICISGIDFNHDKLTNDKIVEGYGIITFINLEGGFFGIISIDGAHYDPINFTSNYKIDGLKVYFKAIIRDDLVSFHMWGILIELTYIRPYYF